MLLKSTILALLGLLLSSASVATSQTQMSPLELGRLHGLCHALRLLMPNGGMGHVAALDAHKQGHLEALSEAYGTLKSSVSMEYDLGYSLAVQGLGHQDRVFSRYCEAQSLDAQDVCVTKLRLSTFDRTLTNPAFQAHVGALYQDRGCEALNLED